MTHSCGVLLSCVQRVGVRPRWRVHPVGVAANQALPVGADAGLVGRRPAHKREAWSSWHSLPADWQLIGS